MNSGWKKELLIILAVSVPFVFLGIGSVSFLDPDEGMYGSIAREMAGGRDWITPHFNGVRYLEKPPLYFWLTALTTALFGPSEWAVRLWSALPTLGTAILVWRIGRLLYGSQAGLLSAIILLTGVGVFRYVRVAATDSLLVFSLTLALYGFVRAALVDQSSKANSEWPIANSRWTIVLFYLGIALAVLSKGLVGLVLPLLIVGLFLLLANGYWQMANGAKAWKLGGWDAGKLSGLQASRPPSFLALKSVCYSLFTNFYSLFANRYSLLGLLVFLVLVLPWHLLAAWKNPGFFEFYIVDNQFLRFFNSRAFIEDDVPVTTIGFLVLIFIWFFPWSLFLSAAFRQGFPNRRLGNRPAERLRLLVGLWALTVVGFFSLSSSKLEHYFLPAIPPLSLMVGALWSGAFSADKPLPGIKWSLVAAVVGCSVAGVSLIILSERLTPQAVFTGLAELNVYYRILKEQGAAFPFPSVTPFVPLVKGVGAVLVIGLPLSLLFFWLHRPTASFVVVIGVAGVIAVLVFKLLFIIEPHHSAKSVALALKDRTHSEDPIVHEGSLEYSASLPFYTGRQIYVLNGKRGDLDFGSRYPETQYLFLDDKEFTHLWEGRQRVFLVTRLQEEENVLRRLSAENVHLLGHYGSRWLYTNKQRVNGK